MQRRQAGVRRKRQTGFLALSRCRMRGCARADNGSGRGHGRGEPQVGAGGPLAGWGTGYIESGELAWAALWASASRGGLGRVAWSPFASGWIMRDRQRDLEGGRRASWCHPWVLTPQCRGGASRALICQLPTVTEEMCQAGKHQLNQGISQLLLLLSPTLKWTPRSSHRGSGEPIKKKELAEHHATRGAPYYGGVPVVGVGRGTAGTLTACCSCG